MNLPEFVAQRGIQNDNYALSLATYVTLRQFTEDFLDGENLLDIRDAITAHLPDAPAICTELLTCQLRDLVEHLWTAARTLGSVPCDGDCCLDPHWTDDQAAMQEREINLVIANPLLYVAGPAAELGCSVEQVRVLLTTAATLLHLNVTDGRVLIRLWELDMQRCPGEELAPSPLTAWQDQLSA